MPAKDLDSIPSPSLSHKPYLRRRTITIPPRTWRHHQAAAYINAQRSTSHAVQRLPTTLYDPADHSRRKPYESTATTLSSKQQQCNHQESGPSAGVITYPRAMRTTAKDLNHTRTLGGMSTRKMLPTGNIEEVKSSHHTLLSRRAANRHRKASERSQSLQNSNRNPTHKLFLGSLSETNDP